jgi:hypothetical protein
MLEVLSIVVLFFLSFCLCTLACERDASSLFASPALKLSDGEDARSDGIPNEINKVLIFEHMKIYAAEQSIAMFSEPGHHDLTLVYEKERPSQRTENFIQLLIDSNTSISPESTWSINTKGSPNCYGNMTSLLQLIRKLPDIVKYEWSFGPIRQDLLETLEEHHPKTHLHYRMSFSEFDGYQDCYDIMDEEDSQVVAETAEQRRERRIAAGEERDEIRAAAREIIINSPILYSLTADVDYGGRGDTSSMDLVHRVLTSCPNIRELELSVGHSGCLVTFEPQPYGFNFDLRRNTLPPLEVLMLSGYG